VLHATKHIVFTTERGPYNLDVKKSLLLFLFSHVLRFNRFYLLNVSIIKPVGKMYFDDIYHYILHRFLRYLK